MKTWTVFDENGVWFGRYTNEQDAQRVAERIGGEYEITRGRYYGEP